jgi:hypothetical protein
MLTTVVVLLALVAGPSAALTGTHGSPEAAPSAHVAAVPPAASTTAARVGAAPAGTVSAGGRVYHTSWTPPLGVAQSGPIVADNVTGTVFSVNYAGALLVAFNGFTGAMERSIILSNDSNEYEGVSIALDNVTGNLYVGLDSGTDYAAELAVINSTTFAWVTNISFATGPLLGFEPEQQLFEFNTNQLLVENYLNQSIIAINTTSNTIATWVDVPCSGTTYYGTCYSEYPMFEMYDAADQWIVILPALSSYAWSIVPDANPALDALATGINSSEPDFIFGPGVYSTFLGQEYFTNASGNGDLVAFDDSGSLLGIVYDSLPGTPGAFLNDPETGWLVYSVENESGPGAQVELVDPLNGLLAAQIANATLPNYYSIDYLADLDAANGTSYVVTGGYDAGDSELVMFGFASPGLEAVLSYSYNPDASLFPIASDSALGLVYELAGGSDQVFALQESTGAVAWVTTSSDLSDSNWLTLDAADGLVYVGTDGSIVALAAGTGAVDAEFPVAYTAGDLAYGYGHLLYAIDGANETIQVYSNAGGATSLAWDQTIVLPAGSDACSLSASPVAMFVADLDCGLGYNETQISSVATGATVANVTGSPNGWAANFNASGYLFVGNDSVGGGTGDVAVYAPSTWALVRTIPTAVPVDFLDFDPAINALVVSGYGTALDIVNATTGATYATLNVPGVSDDGQWPAVDAATGAIADAGSTGETLLATLVALPGAAGGLAVTSGNGTLAVSWTAATGASGYPVTGYLVFTGAAATGPWTQAGSATTATSATATGLTDGTTYYVTVRATSGSGTGPAATAVSATPVGVPYPPSGVAVSAPTSSTLTVGWNAPSANGGASISAYTVLYATSASGPWTSAPAGTATTGTLSGLSAGTTYYVKVEAANSVGTGNPSAAAQGTTSSSGSGSTSGSGLPGGSLTWIVIAVIVVVVVVALAAAMLMRRGNAPPPSSGAPPDASSPPGAPPPGTAGGSPPPPPATQ